METRGVKNSRKGLFQSHLSFLPQITISLLSWPFNFFLSLAQFCLSLYQHFHTMRRSRGGRGRSFQAMAIPEHVLADILARLPVASLVRFTAVRKSWQHLIRNPGFISDQLNFNAKENPQGGRLLVKYRSQTTRKHAISLLFPGTYVHTLSNLDIPYAGHSDHLIYLGCCNGLLCLVQNNCGNNRESNIVLWNPAIREVRLLPDNLIREYCGVTYGFGYHPLIDDYKLVRAVPLLGWAEVYSLKTDCWREVGTFRFDVYGSSCTARNGVLYWTAYGRGDRELIVSFDMYGDVFGELQLPDMSLLERPMCTKLATLQESLCLIAYTFSGRQKEFYVWKMVEDDGNVDWKMELKIGPLLGVERPLGCGLHGEIYIESRKGELMLYNRNTEETASITLGLRSSLEVHFYVESLVSTNGQMNKRFS